MTALHEKTSTRRLFYEEAPKLWQPTYLRFQQLLRSHLLFHMAFLLLLTLEGVLFLSFWLTMPRSSLLALTLAIFFLTLFSYFILRLYARAKRAEQLFTLQREYLDSCKERIGYAEGVPEHHIALANAATKFSVFLSEKEYRQYRVLAAFAPLTTTVENLSARLHWRAFHALREGLLFASIEEHLQIVRSLPTHLEVHAALANAYVTLSALYAQPREEESERWVPPERTSKEMREQFRRTAEKAIEEFRILNDYAPDDPWVHMQLAYSYRDLQMPEEEIREYERLLVLQPDEEEVLFKLGMLYFQQGRNAKGLQMYAELQKRQSRRAERLIAAYGKTLSGIQLR